MVMVALVSGQDARAEARGQEKKKARGGLKWEKDGFLKFHALLTICPSFLGMAPKILIAYFLLQTFISCP